MATAHRPARTWGFLTFSFSGIMAARRVLLGVSGLGAIAAGVGYTYVALGAPEPPLPDAPWSSVSAPAKHRREHIKSLKASGARQTKRNTTQPFDVLIIGGGATGAGAALDAATRGLKVALVEQEDFASGTSSRSTKLVHGGVRYLEKAVFQLDPGQFKLVFEALKERQVLLKNAPHLTWPLPIATPCYQAWEVRFCFLSRKIMLALYCVRRVHVWRFLVRSLRDSSSSRYQAPNTSQYVRPTVCPYKRLTRISKILGSVLLGGDESVRFRRGGERI